LSYREAPAVISAVSKCSDFDVLLVNGHGIAHPRGCGLATFVGLQLNMSTIGVARRRLVGSIGKRKDSWAPIIEKGKIVGAELWKNNKSPIYVSVGNRIRIESVIRVIRNLQIRSSIPEPLRLAHKEAKKLKKSVQFSTPNVI
jgi:deoxyribonuclease V